MWLRNTYYLKIYYNIFAIDLVLKGVLDMTVGEERDSGWVGGVNLRKLLLLMDIFSLTDARGFDIELRIN